jgi:D-galactarolactone isomerase
MINRKLSGQPPKVKLPAGSIDTQMHMYIDGFAALPGGPGLPQNPLPTPDMYRQVMEWLGIDRVVITQGNAHQADNTCLLACLENMGSVAKGVAVITPDASETEIEQLINAGVVGARIMDLPGGAIGLEALETIDAMCQEAGWMLAVQLDGSALPELESRLSTIKSRWVLDHHGKIFSGATKEHLNSLKRLMDKGNFWFKFAGCYESSRSGGPLYNDIATIAKELGTYSPERIVWGTNWPHNLAVSETDYPDDAVLVDTVLAWLKGNKAIEKALVNNPQELFGFENFSSCN